MQCLHQVFTKNVVIDTTLHKILIVSTWSSYSSRTMYKGSTWHILGHLKIRGSEKVWKETKFWTVNVNFSDFRLVFGSLVRSSFLTPKAIDQDWDWSFESERKPPLSCRNTSRGAQNPPNSCFETREGRGGSKRETGRDIYLPSHILMRRPPSSHVSSKWRVGGVVEDRRLAFRACARGRGHQTGGEDLSVLQGGGAVVWRRTPSPSHNSSEGEVGRWWGM